MTPNALLVEQMQIVPAFGPVDLQSAANNGDWVSMKNHERCTIVFFKAAGTAGDDPILTVRQATDVSGTGAKALNFTRIDQKTGTLASVGQFTTVTQAAANTYTDATHAEVAALYVIDIKAEDLDVDGGFDCVQFQVPDVGTNAQLGAALYLLWPARHAPQPLPSTIAD